MSPRNAPLIYQNRQRAAELMNDPHVKQCTCCADDLAIVLEDPASSVGRCLLAGVERRITARKETE